MLVEASDDFITSSHTLHCLGLVTGHPTKPYWHRLVLELFPSEYLTSDATFHECVGPLPPLRLCAEGCHGGLMVSLDCAGLCLRLEWFSLFFSIQACRIT